MENKYKIRATSDTDAWGYAVCFGTAITFIAGIGHVNSFGLIYKDFIVDTNSTAKSLTTAHGVFAIMLAVGGLLLSMLSKRYSLRLGGFIGATLFTMGSFFTIFISNTNQLILTFGVLQGIGFGMMVPVCYLSINYYFVRKRTFVMSAIKAVQGIIVMWYPQFIKVITSCYGFRGTLLILTGISLHMFPGALTMQLEKRTAKTKRIATDDIEKRTNSDQHVDLLLNTDNVEDIKPRCNLADKMILLGSEVLELLNLKVLKDLVYCNICLGQSFVNFSDLTFFILQPMLLFQYGFDKSQVATCISIGAGADVAGRFGLALISGLYPVNTRFLYYIATFFTLLVRIAILHAQQYIWIVGITGVLGILRACLHVASPLVISNHVSHEDFPGAYALFMLTAGVINVMLAPFIGSLKDLYADYVPSFYALVFCCIPCLVLWPLEYIFIK
ncbi:monocarboxylate transporter 9-like [Zerene cesonia]|uniref:monocarboxylate transporter 9-like n=1 Tax=Zerene cesonia TaxID=33412 RepID=UPI0018E562E8|nr:monocarboxylate transporter 9-like [Zerene cesonia]